MISIFSPRNSLTIAFTLAPFIPTQARESGEFMDYENDYEDYDEEYEEGYEEGYEEENTGDGEFIDGNE